MKKDKPQIRNLNRTLYTYRGQSQEGPVLLEHVISINMIKNYGPNKCFDLKGDLDFQMNLPKRNLSMLGEEVRN